MANLEERREKNRLRGKARYHSLTVEEKKEFFRKSRERYRNASPELLQKRRDRNRRWYARHPEVIHRKNRKPSQRYSFSKSHALRSGRIWNIALSDFVELISKRCHYCDGGLPESGSGLDRMDNSKGYIIGNVVPCCRGCNVMKGDRLTYEEMVVAAGAVKSLRLSKVISNG